MKKNYTPVISFPVTGFKANTKSMSQYAVIGDPVQHSKSPVIHRLFAAQTGQAVQYEAIRVESNSLREFIIDFFANGGAGLNVTLPHKEAVYALVDSCSQRATLAKAVNTLFKDSAGQLCGDNTDGVGLIRDIQDNHRFTIKGKRLLVLGAGGAVRGVIGPLLEAQPATLSLANRTVSKAEQLVLEFSSHGIIKAGAFADFSGEEFDLVINGTSMGIHDEVPAIDDIVLATQSCCYDMMYKSGDTAFVTWAKHHGSGVALDGLGMLVEQAAEAFAIWRGVRPETAPVIRQLRS